jgi:hypothetical protein
MARRGRLFQGEQPRGVGLKSNGDVRFASEAHIQCFGDDACFPQGDMIFGVNQNILSANDIGRFHAANRDHPRVANGSRPDDLPRHASAKAQVTGRSKRKARVQENPKIP